MSHLKPHLSVNKSTSFSPISYLMTTGNNNFSFLPLLPIDDHQGRIIHVTHQIPFEVIHETDEEGSLQWTFRPRHEHAAMYAGIHSLIDEWETLCIGWTGQIYKDSPSLENVDRYEIDMLGDQEKESLQSQLYQEHNCIPLFLDSSSVAGHYHGYCKTCKCLTNFILKERRTDTNPKKSIVATF